MTDLYSVIGNPVEHSLSPRIHTMFAKANSQNLIYSKIMCSKDTFVKAVAEFRDSGGVGLNVTVPFKADAADVADKRSKLVAESGVANVLYFKNGKIIADNTDGLGLVIDLKKNLDFGLKGKRILILGAGGACAGSLGPILAEMPRHVTITNRTLENAERLVGGFQRENVIVEASSIDDLVKESYDLIINSTSASLFGVTLALPKEIFSADSLAYDMMYGNQSLDFLGSAKKSGAAKVADGIGMLVEQAAESFLIWRGIRPKTKNIIRALGRISNGNFSS